MKSHFPGLISTPARLVLVTLIVLTGFLEARADTSSNVAPDGLKWDYVYPTPTAAWLTSVASGPLGFVAVGGNGEILFSQDGLQWTNADPSEGRGIGFAAVCFAGDRYLAVGYAGEVLWSFDGLHWTASDTGVTVQLRACVGRDGLYIVAGLNQTLLVSTNCINWEQRAVPDDIWGIALGSSNCVAISRSAIFTSSDLQHWIKWSQNLPFPGPYLNSVNYSSGQFMVGGAWSPDFLEVFGGSIVLSSTDGEVWQFSGLNGFGERVVTSAGGLFVAIRSGSVLRSDDGTNWEEISNVPSHGGIRAICGSATGRFVAVGDSGEIVVSDDARTWIEVTENPREWLNALAFAEGRFVAVGGTPSYIGGPQGTAAVFTSTNGYDWNASLTNLPNQLSSVAFGRKKWVVTGDDGQIFVSEDGFHWTDRSIPSTSHDLSQVVFGNGVFTAFASGRDLVYRSRDAVHWHEVKARNASTIWKPQFLGHRLVAAATNGIILFSADGLHWKARQTPTARDLRCVTYGNKLFVAAGDSVIVYSRDGKHWETVDVPISVQQLKFVEGYFFAFGASGEVLISSDAVDWNQFSEQGGGVQDLIASGNGFLVKGSGQSFYRGTFQRPLAARLLRGN